MTYQTIFGRLVRITPKIPQGSFVMFVTNKSGPRRILIASSHPLFAEGLRSLLLKRPEMDAAVVGMVSTIDEALSALKALHPDMVIVDYDDERVNRDEFLARFVEGEGRLRVVLLSLKEGGSEAIVYDRRTMAASQIEDWLASWNEGQGQSTGSTELVDNKADPNAIPRRRSDMKHFIAAALVVVGLIVVTFFGLQRIDLLPVQASLQAIPIDNLFKLHFTTIAVLFSLIVGLMVYSIVVFRRRRGDTSDGPHIEGNPKIEVAWTIVPLVFVLYVAYVGGIALGKTQAADPKPLEVNVIGSQWAWRFEYPKFGINSTELRLPVDKQALLTISSTDVIHSFWVMEFRIKQDALPGEGFEREIRITPDRVGAYKVRCAELCGRLHYNMESPVLVMEQADFDAWVQSQTSAVSNDPVVRGDKYTQQYGCRACHSIDGSALVGPSWKGLYGMQEALTDGSSVLVDDTYITESIRNPGVKITAGFQNLMPANIAASMTDEQIADVIEFIKSLK